MSERDDANQVAEFAALLTRLKGQTDRSYGQLARRLNMNTSTLHRYCAGETVPVDFAPVERFAALCGATPEERHELHRVWLRAVAARRRSRPQEPTAAGPTLSPTSATQPSPPPAPGPEPAPAPEPSPSPTPERTATSTPEPGPAPAPAPVEEGETDPVTELSVAPGGPRPWYRRRRALVGSAVAVALVATLGSLSALSDEGSSSADSVRPTDPPLTTPAAPASPGPTSSKRPPGSSASPDRTASPSASGSGRSRPAPSAEGDGSPTGGAAPGAAVPLSWTVDSHVWNAGCGHHYVIDKPPAQVPPPPVAQDAATWAGAQGALHGGDTMVQISVQGRSSTAVVLEALRVRVARRAAPADGNSYAMDNGCGGALTPRSFSVDLDADRPIARSEAGYDGVTEKEIPAMRMPYRVSATDPEILLVTARTVTCDCDWYLELDWSSQGRTGTARIDDHGTPFRTTGDKKLPQYAYDTSGRKWVSGS
ncbi:transcriptional regulator [Streptomyces sp. Act143]|uniref:helix-turn-helix domain-containing protein n=1 Tax=Streptomyces sp. Act143 TaxID=2200760 RepID=UPI000D676064|nr:helix-turn-helix transcriptional regulator [Streptomyces sp. Act143]PWI14579.1 transcriptional regulator [Streptomyces sp. Act143]